MADSSTLVDRVKIFVESSGTGPFHLGNAVPAFRGSGALTDGLTYSYAVESGSDYEVGRGVYVLAVDQLLRAPTLSSAGGAPVAFPANVTINFTALAADLTAGLAGTGTVTSIQGSGGTTGMTLTGGPITGAGTLTLGGTLGLANGGTGGTTAAEARSGIDLGNVDNTSDAAKPVSTATQAALDERALITDLASPTGGAMVGNQLPAGDDLRTQPVSDFISNNVLMPSQFAGTAEQQVLGAIAEANESRNGGLGQTVLLPRGETEMAASFNIGNRCSLAGVNKRGSRLIADSAHTGPYMVTVVNGTTSTFDNALERLTLDCNDVAGLGGVVADAWQEGGGLRNVLIQKFRTYGVYVRNGYGGASTLLIDGAELFGSGAAAADAGIYVEQVSTLSNFLVHVTNSTITGDIGVPMDYGIYIENDSLHCHVVHFEEVESGIYLDGGGNHVLIGVTGATTVTNVVEIASNFTGTLTMLGCFRGGATNLIKDNRLGGVGTIAIDQSYFEITADPPISPGSDYAWGTFNGSTVGTPSTDFCKGVSGITRNSAGSWTITLTRSLPSADDMIPYGVVVNINGVEPPQVSKVGVNTFSIALRTLGGTPIDANEIKFAVKRL